MNNKTNSLADCRDVLLTDDEFVRIRASGEEYAKEANRCASSPLHPCFSGCMLAASAIHSSVLQVIQLRADQILDLHMAPHEKRRIVPLRLWSMSETIRMTEYMGWFPRKLSLDEKQRFHIEDSALSITRLCHVHELLRPDYFMRGVKASSKKRALDVWRDELTLWLNINKMILADVYGEAQTYLLHASSRRQALAVEKSPLSVGRPVRLSLHPGRCIS